MMMKDKFVKPITFNTYKHHFHFLLEILPLWQHFSWEKVENEIKVIGENLIDLYLGNLDVEQIYNECITYIESINIHNKTGFDNWLLPHQYKKIVLSDGSTWILKSSINKQKYIHIHPGKYSTRSIRVRGTTLKTALTVMYFAICTNNLNQIDLRFVNLIRSKYLGISPIKSLQHNQGLKRILDLFIKHYQLHYR